MSTTTTKTKGTSVKKAIAPTQEQDQAASTIKLARLRQDVMTVRIRGTAPLIVHRFDEKARQMMLDAQTQKVRTKKAAKDPYADYEASLYRCSDGSYGFPAVGFKAAIVGAARQFEGVTMVQLRTVIHVIGRGSEQLVPLEGEPEMREDVVRVGMGVADLRYRGVFNEWGATLVVRFIPTAISAESVIALIDAGGFGGIGEWRPSAPKSNTGSFGTFEVVEQ